MSGFVLVFVYQSYMTKGITSGAVGHFSSRQQCEAAASILKREDFDKTICLEVGP